MSSLAPWRAQCSRRSCAKETDLSCHNFVPPYQRAAQLIRFPHIHMYKYISMYYTLFCHSLCLLYGVQALSSFLRILLEVNKNIDSLGILMQLRHAGLVGLWLMPRQGLYFSLVISTCIFGIKLYSRIFGRPKTEDTC